MSAAMEEPSERLDDSAESNKLVIDDSQVSEEAQNDVDDNSNNSHGDCSEGDNNVPTFQPGTSSAEEALAALESSLKKFHNRAEDKHPNSNEKNSNRRHESQGYKSDFFVTESSEGETVPTCRASGSLVAVPSSSKPPDTLEGGSMTHTVPDSNKLETATSQCQPANTVAEKQLVLDPEKITQDWSSVGVHRCPICKFSTDDQELLKNHTTTCTAPKPPDGKGEVKITFSDGIFKCENCNITWTNRAEFEEHLVCHIVPEPYVCMTCKKNFVSRYLIEKHAKTEHPNGDSKCGLKGIKKTRKLLGDLETNRVLIVSGKLSVPQTPRNLVKAIPMSTSATIPPPLAGTVNTCGTASSKSVPPATISSALLQTQPSETTSQQAAVSSLLRPDNSKNIETIERQDDIAKTPFEEVSGSKHTGAAPNMDKMISNIPSSVSQNRQQTNCSMVSTATSSSVIAKSITGNSSETESISVTTTVDSPPLFGILNTETSTLTPASIPSKIQKVINDTSVVSGVMPVAGEKISVKKDLGKDIQSKPAKHHVVHFTSSQSRVTTTATTSPVQTNIIVQNPPYQVKHFTEFTSAGPVTTTDATIASHPLLLIPVGPVMQPFHTQSVLFTDAQGKMTTNPQITHGQIIQQPQISHGQIQQPLVTQGQIIQQPLITQSQIIQQPLITQSQIIQQPLVTQSQVIQRPLITQSQVIQQPLVTQSQVIQQPLVTQSPMKHAGNVQISAVQDQRIPSHFVSQEAVKQPTIVQTQTNLRSLLLPKGMQTVPQMPLQLSDLQQTENVQSFVHQDPQHLLQGKRQNSSQHTVISMKSFQKEQKNQAAHQPSETNTQKQQQMFDTQPFLQQSRTEQSQVLIVNHPPTITVSKGVSINQSSHQTTNTLPTIGNMGIAQTGKTVADLGHNCLTKYEESASAVVSINIHELGKPSTSPSAVSDSSKQNHHLERFQYKKLLFRIKPKHGFVCEGCRKFTRDEFVFRKHAWDHCHEQPMACKMCTREQINSKEILSCSLVNDIVCSLIKNSALNLQKAQQNALDQNDVIDISDDENDYKSEKNPPDEAAVCVEDDNKSDMHLKISSTFSLTDMDDLVDNIIKDHLVDETQKQTVKSETTQKKDISQLISVDTIQNTHQPDNENCENTNRTKGPVELPSQNSEVRRNDLEKNNSLVRKVSGAEDGNNSIDSAIPNELCALMYNENIVISSKYGIVRKSDLDKTCSQAYSREENTNESQMAGQHHKDEYNSSAAKKQSHVSQPGKPHKEIKKAETAIQNEQLNEKLNKGEQIEQSDTPTVNASLQTCVMKGTTSKSDSNKNDSTNADDAARNLFESEVLATQSYNSFYMCGYETCAFSCLSSQRYKEHLQVKHLDEYNYVCCHCGLKDYSEETHVRHLSSHATNQKNLLYSCPFRLCKFGTNLVHMYEKHVKGHKEEDMAIKCVYCHQIFPTIDGLILHLKQNLLKFFSCTHCSFRFTQKNVVTKHMKLFHPDKLRMVTVTSQVVCLEREINFFVTPLAKRQAQDNADEGDGSSTAIDIPRILDEVQSRNGPSAVKDIDGEIKNCQSSATEETKIGEHGKDIKKSGPVKKRGPKSKEKSIPVVSESQKKVMTPAGPMSLQCPHCSYLSHNQSFYVQHVSLHEGETEREKRYVCNLCPKGFDILPQFKKHMLNHIGRNEIKVFYCTSCSYSSNQKCHIMDHGKENHGGKGTYTMKVDVVISTETSCKYCDFKARQAEHVVQHEELVHRVKNGNQPKPNVPDSCPEEKQPTTKPEDGEHGKKKKKYHCDYCNGRFKHKHDLKKHLEMEHTDIENKQFISYKCMYCNSYSSSMKNVIVDHINKKHVGEKEKKILRKIEIVKTKGLDSSEDKTKANPERKVYTTAKNDEPESDGLLKQTVQIPPGNIFKVPFKCPLCSFSNNLRLNVIRHIKTHTELIPEMVSNKDGKEEVSKKTARKSTWQKKMVSTPVANRPNSLVQDLPESSKLVNPFAALKEKITEKDGDATKDPFILGEYKLHKSLSACFIPMENDVKFKCRICQQKIAKKFVLHRHILNHLGIDFFKCGYCDEGSIEKTLMFGHIQKEHMQKPIRFNELDTFELESELKEKIFSQNFVDAIDNCYSGGIQEKESKDLEPRGITKITASNTDTAKLSTTNENLSDSAPDKLERHNEHKVLQCPLCRYVAYRKSLLKVHIQSHSDPNKKYTCSVCDYRGDNVACIKHIYNSKHGKKNAKVLKDGELVLESERHSKVSKELCKANTVRDMKHSGNSATSSKGESAGHTDKINSQGKKRNGESVKDKSGGLYEMKTILKCKDCGLKRESVSSMYRHFKVSSCKRPFYQCSLCSFQSPFKNAITKHAKLRHEGKKIEICDVSLRSKMKTMKVPVKQDSSYLNEMTPISDAKREISPVSCTSALHTDEEDKKSAISEQGNMMCQLCKSQSFENVMRLQAHINSMHDGKMLYCQVCVYKSPIVKHMINHCTNLHRQKVATYELEPKRSATKRSGDKKVDGPEKTRTSSESVLSGEDKDENKRFMFKCPECSYETNLLAPMTRHVYTHFDYKPFVCKYCNVAMSNVGSIRRHIANIHGNKSIKYTLKKNVSVEKKARKMVDRIRSAKDNENCIHSCDMCDYRSSNKSKFDKHVAEKHPQVNSKKRSQLQKSGSDSSSPVKKKKKLSVISTSSGKDSDEEDMHPTPQKYQVSLDSNGGRQFSCGQCDYKTGKKKHLRRHLVTHGSSLYRCYYCNFSIKMCTKAYSHVETKHPGERVQIWNKKTNEVMVKKDATSPASSLNSSISGATGSDVRNRSQKESSPQILMYYCSQCTWKNKGLYKFREHLACHPEFICRSENVVVDSKLACGYCSHVSRNENEFSRHIESHLGERPFQCAYCSYSVFEKTKILYHSRQLHPKEKAIVIDRTVRRKHSLNVTLVDFDPKLILKRVDSTGRKTKALKEIEDSVDDVEPSRKRARGVLELAEESDDEVSPMRKKPSGILESDDETKDVGMVQSQAGSSSKEVIKSMESSVEMQEVAEKISMDNVMKKGAEQDTSIANVTLDYKNSAECLNDTDCQDHIKKNAGHAFANQEYADFSNAHLQSKTADIVNSELVHEDVEESRKVETLETKLDDRDSVCGQADKNVPSLLQPQGEILYIATKVDKVVESDPNSVHTNSSEGFSQQFSSESQGFEVGDPEPQSFGFDLDELQEEDSSEKLKSSIVEASDVPDISDQVLPVGNHSNESLVLESRPEDSKLCGVAEPYLKNDGILAESCKETEGKTGEIESKSKARSALSGTEIGINKEGIDTGEIRTQIGSGTFECKVDPLGASPSTKHHSDCNKSNVRKEAKALESGQNISSIHPVTEHESHNEADKNSIIQALESAGDKTEISSINSNATSSNGGQTHLFKDGGIRLEHKIEQSLNCTENELTEVNEKEKSSTFDTVSVETMNNSDRDGSYDNAVSISTERRNIFDEFENNSGEMDYAKNDVHIDNALPVNDERSTENSNHGNVFEKFARGNEEVLNSLAEKDECDEVKDNIFDKFNGVTC